MILAGRQINDGMGGYIADNAVKQLIKAGVDVCRCKVAVFGFTFKEDCPDIRNTRVIDIINRLEEYKIVPQVYDPVADCVELRECYGFELTPIEMIEASDCLIIAVCHHEFMELNLSKYLKRGGLLVDVKGIFKPETVSEAGCRYWRL
jgi:UDP-N-acetyl-D-galactosamine dehydrogenase